MPDHMVERAALGVRRFREAYYWLARRAVDQDLHMFKIRPKFHMMEHQVMLMEHTGLNPRFWSCWMDEDITLISFARVSMQGGGAPRVRI